ncbi:MAG: VWA domain-containing protein [bacterium]|nr:VWA domain-containing protein [bacterium]
MKRTVPALLPAILFLLLTACMHQETVTPVAADAPVPGEQPAAAHIGQESRQRADAMKVRDELASRKSGRVAGAMLMAAPASVATSDYAVPAESREKYQNISDNPVRLTTEDSVSTFSLDVDTGSYSNVRRFLNQGQLPPADAVRVEELVNYFPYDYPDSLPGHPFALSTEIAPAPWNSAHYLLRIGVKTVEKNVAAMPPANLVFLVDVSGSMNSPDKLPLVQSTLQLLTAQLRPQDRVAMVVYAGRTAVELESTPGNQKEKIRAAIARLQAGGSTAGESAIRLAYAQARAGYIRGGINRILLATDGDFNVGISDIEQIKDMVKRERESGISLTTLGFGQGNYQEALMEQIADAGNGNYSYIDSLSEARKVLVEELSSTFNTVAKDVKIQMEFNPKQVAEWRLVGYENRVLREEDFRNDKVDAGDVGAGKSVTALYEITPVGAATLHASRRYSGKPEGQELGFLRIRYKQPDASTSVELARAVLHPGNAALAHEPSADFRFTAAVAGFGQLLRQSPYTGTFGYQDVKTLAEKSIGSDKNGYRREFITLVGLAKSLTPAKPLNDVRTQDGHAADAGRE